MGKASSDESVPEEILDEAEEIGRELENRKISHDADDLFFLELLKAQQPDLVPRTPNDYYSLYEKYRMKVPGYTSHRKVAESEGLESHGSVGVQFRVIEDAILKMRQEQSEPTVEIPALDSNRIAEILKKGKLVQLDPRMLLPPEGHQHYKLSRYFQKRRAPRDPQRSLKILAASIAQMGVIDPPIVQEGGSHNGFIRRFIDGFGRGESWIIADTEAGGTDKEPVLEYPVCLVVDCTDAESDLIALEKNQNKENFDLGDRDYSIVTMYERYPQTYTQKVLAELFNLDKTQISHIISAWRESYPWDFQKKGETPLDNPIRRALEERKITTYHGRQLARLKKWPSEQKRIANWLLQETEKYSRKDAHLEEQWDTDEIRGQYKYFKFDAEGISAGHLKMMVSKAVENMEHAEAIQKVGARQLKDGKLESKITVDEFEKLRADISKERTGYSDKIPKSYVEKGLKAAGIKIVTPKPDVEKMKPVSPATAKAVEVEPLKVCANCQAAFLDNLSCQIGLSPTDENECAVQSIFPGYPRRDKMRCLHCGGITFKKFLEDLEIDTEWDENDTDGSFLAHDICAHDAILRRLDIKGQCHSCNNPGCELLAVVESGGLDVEVKHCPEDQWFTPRPTRSIEEINAEVQSRIDKFVTEARKQFEKAKSAGRSD